MSDDSGSENYTMLHKLFVLATILVLRVASQKCFDSNVEFRAAIDEYVNSRGNKSSVALQYGWAIGSWCVSNVRDMTDVFQMQRYINEPLEAWDVLSPTNNQGNI